MKASEHMDRLRKLVQEYDAVLLRRNELAVQQAELDAQMARLEQAALKVEVAEARPVSGPRSARNGDAAQVDVPDVEQESVSSDGSAAEEAEGDSPIVFGQRRVGAFQMTLHRLGQNPGTSIEELAQEVYGGVTKQHRKKVRTILYLLHKKGEIESFAPAQWKLTQRGENTLATLMEAQSE